MTNLYTTTLERTYHERKYFECRNKNRENPGKDG